VAGRCSIDIVDDRTGQLFVDWEPDDVAVLDAAVGYHPTWAVVIDMSDGSAP
jgi:hypothetical protein